MSGLYPHVSLGEPVIYLTSIGVDSKHFGSDLYAEDEASKCEQTQAGDSVAERTAGRSGNKRAQSLSPARKTAWPLVTCDCAQ